MRTGEQKGTAGREKGDRQEWHLLNGYIGAVTHKRLIPGQKKGDRQVFQGDCASDGFRLCLSEGPGGTERLEMDDLAMERTKRC